MLKRVLAHIVAFVAVLLVIAFAPILTLGHADPQPRAGAVTKETLCSDRC